MHNRFWYAAYTQPHHEKKVAEHLNYREFECFLPLYSTVRRWRNRTDAALELPLFPGYVFLKARPVELHAVASVPSVVRIVGCGRQAIAIPAAELEALRNGLSLLKAEPYPYIRIGDRVRVIRGPLADLEGQLIQKKNGFRFVLSMDLIMQAVAVEIDAADVEAVASSSRPEVLQPRSAFTHVP